MAVVGIILKDRNQWHVHRNSFIGGSDASAILGMNPYMSNVELWQIKTGRISQEDISEKPYVKYGVAAEQHLRDLFQLDFPQYEVRYKENNSILNDRFPWAAASLDGILIEKDTGRKGVLEIKTTNILQSMQKEKWNEKIPDNYYVQILHYLMVTEFEFAVLKAQIKSEYGDMPYLQTRHYLIERSDVQDDISFLEEEERKFWELVKLNKQPALKLPEI